MLESRTRGISTLQGLIILFILPMWFLFSVYIAVDWVNKMNYSQVNFPLYSLGVILASLLSFGQLERSMPRGSNRFQWVDAVRSANSSIFILALVLFGIVFATKDKAISRLFLGTFITSTWFLLLPLNRYLPEWLSSIVFRGKNTMRTILVGNVSTTKNLDDWVLDRPPLGMNIIGLVTYEEDRNENGEGSSIPILGDAKDFEKIVEDNQVHQVILLETRRSKTWVSFIMKSSIHAGCRILILNNWEEYFNLPLTPVKEGDHTFFTLQDEPLENPLNRIVKRILDLTISIPVVLLILPLFSVIVKCFQLIQSSGPLLFRQERSGFYKRKFNIYKFRTMELSPEKSDQEAEQATRDDTRIYPFGKYLRQSSLDELPQFVNVMLGEMSIVGPRPHLLQHDEEFRKMVEIYRIRHFVKPGITGLAQSQGYRGEIKNVENIRERIRLDLEYIHNWSVWLEIGIILRTLAQVIFPPKSAY